MISLNYRDSRPIYEQVREGFKKLIMSGALAPGDKLPSVRELATELAINPNTIQRAYRELEAEGCIYSLPGKGSFAAELSGLADARRAELFEKLESAAAELMAMGVGREELETHLDLLDRREK